MEEGGAGHWKRSGAKRKKTKNDGRAVGKIAPEKNDRLMIDGPTGEEEMSGEADEKKNWKGELRVAGKQILRRL